MTGRKGKTLGSPGLKNQLGSLAGRTIRRAATFFLAGACIVIFPLCSPAFAQTARSRLIKEYQDFYTGSRPFYQSSPVTHVVPEFNTVTHSLDVKFPGVTVTPSGSSATKIGANHETMKISGYVVSPYMSVSLKKFGLGFNVEAGDQSLKYESVYNAYSSLQTSKLVHRGIGIFGFAKWIDGPVWDMTFVAGGRTINNVHNVGAFKSYGSDSNTADKVYRYAVSGYEAGINNELHLTQKVTVAPWVNYSALDTSDATDQVEGTGYFGTTLSEDVDVFWKSRRETDYGIDLSIRVGRVDVRIGGLLGLVLTSAGGKENIADGTYSLTLTVDQKG